MTDITKPWLNLEEAADYFGVSAAVMRRKLGEYGIPHVKVGRQYRIARTHLEDGLLRAAEQQVGA